MDETNDRERAALLLGLALDDDNEAGAATFRDYLRVLATAVWREGEAFDGKRPFGFSDWKSDVYQPMVAAGLVAGELDEEECLVSVDEDAADALVYAAIGLLHTPQTPPPATPVRRRRHHRRPERWRQGTYRGSSRPLRLARSR